MRAALFFICLGLFTSSHLAAQNLEGFRDWDLQFNNTARYDHYTVSGNKAASPFSHSGHQAYNEFDGQALRNFSPYERFRGQFTGVVNQSRYRSTDRGFVPERVNMFYENGEGFLPYRVETGDFFANLSYRTEQQSLKGASVELQPELSWFSDQSLIVFSGQTTPSWQHVGDSLDVSSGASWLIRREDMGRVALNFVHNLRNGTPAAGGGVALNDAHQFIKSLAWGKDGINIFSEQLNIDAEIAKFDGDHNTLLNNKNKSSEGYYVELNGNSTELPPLFYRFRFEDYGKDFRPAHALITPDRRAVEGHAGWRFDNGMVLRGRAQHYADGFHTNTNILDTRLFGATLNGPVMGEWAPDVSGRFDLYRQDVTNQANTLNFTQTAFRADLSKPITESWNLDGTFITQLQDDYSPTNRDFDLYQWGAGATYSFLVDGWNGNIRPGLIFRDYTGKIDQQFDVQPALSFYLNQGGHNLDVGFNTLVQDRAILGQTDDRTHNVNFDYRYQSGAHELGLTGALFDRDVSPGTNTTASRIGLYWTFHFHKPEGEISNVAAISTPAAADPSVTQSTPYGKNIHDAADLIAALSPATNMDEAKQQAANYGLSTPVETTRAAVYEANFLPLSLRQRLVLEKRGNKLERSAIVIDADNLGNMQQLSQDYGRIRDYLLSALGRPSRETRSSNAPFSGLDDNSVLLKNMEWQTADGWIRFGLTRSTSGTLRFEIQHARTHNPNNNFWGVNF